MNTVYIYLIVALLGLIHLYNPSAEQTSFQNEEDVCCVVSNNHSSSSYFGLFDLEDDEDETEERHFKLHASQVCSSVFILENVSLHGLSYFNHFILFETDTSPPIV